MFEWLFSLLRPKYAQLQFDDETISRKLAGWKVMLYFLISMLFGLSLCMVFFQSERDVCLGLIVIGLTVPFARYRQVSSQAERRKRQIVVVLPIWLNQLLIRLAAGDTLYNAMLHTATIAGENDGPWYDLLHAIVPQLRNNRNMEYVMEELNRQTRMIEVSQLSTILLLHSRKGGDELSIALRDFCKRLWEQRKHEMLKRGERLSVKLVIPMMVLFLDVMIVIAAPAILSANWIS